MRENVYSIDAAGYLVLCKDVLEESWENCESVSR